VESILDQRQSVKSYVGIADQLNANEVKSRSGGRWHPTQVQRVLRRVLPSEESRTRL
jgi:hypothetical protein